MSIKTLKDSGINTDMGVNGSRSYIFPQSSRPPPHNTPAFETDNGIGKMAVLRVPGHYIGT